MKNIHKAISILIAMFLSILMLNAKEGMSKIEYVEVDKVVNINGKDIEVLRPIMLETKTTKSNDTNKNRENNNYVEVDKVVNINGREIEVLRPIRVQVSTTYSKDKDSKKLAQEEVQREAEKRHA